MKEVSQKSDFKYELDELDRQILYLLAQDASSPYTDVARELNVSSGTIHVRMRRLEEENIVLGSHLNLALRRLGYDVCAFVGVFLDKGHQYLGAIDALKAIEQVVEVHFTTGNYSVFLKVRCVNTDALREVLNDKIQKIDGVQRTETIISLEEHTNNVSRLIQALPNHHKKPE